MTNIDLSSYPDTVSFKEMNKILGIGHDKGLKIVANKEVDWRYVDKKYYISKKSIERYIEKHGVKIRKKQAKDKESR